MSGGTRIPAPWLCWAAAGAVLVCVLAPAAVSASGASSRARTARATYETARQHAQVILDSRGTVPTQSSDGLAEAAIAAMSAAGLDRGALDSLTPDSAEATTGSASIRRASLSLRCTLPQLGKLLEVWPRFAPGWTITAVDLSPTEQRGREAAPGPQPLRALLTLEGVFAQGGGA